MTCIINAKSAGQITILQSSIHAVHHQQNPPLGLDHPLHKLPQPHLDLVLTDVSCDQLIGVYLIGLGKDLFLMFLEPLSGLVGQLEDVEVMDDLIFAWRDGLLRGFGFVEDFAFALFCAFLLACLKFFLGVEDLDPGVDQSLFLVFEAEGMVGAFGGSWAGFLGLGAEDAAVDWRFAVTEFWSLRRLDLSDGFLHFWAFKGWLKGWSMGRTQSEYFLTRTALPGTILTQLPRILQLLQLLLDLLTPLLGTLQILISQPILLKIFLLEWHLSSED